MVGDRRSLGHVVCCARKCSIAMLLGLTARIYEQVNHETLSIWQNDYRVVPLEHSRLCRRTRRGGDRVGHIRHWLSAEASRGDDLFVASTGEHSEGYGAAP